MFEESTRSTALRSRVYYAKGRKRVASEKKTAKAEPLAVHLSCMIQQERLQAINQEMRQLASKLDCSHHSDIFQLT
jgi:hypothetical protein